MFFSPSGLSLFLFSSVCSLFFSCLAEREPYDSFSKNVTGWIRVLAARSVFKAYRGVGTEACSAGVVCGWESHPPRRPPSLPCSGPSAPQLIPGSLHRYRSALASHQRTKKCSPPLVACQSLPLLLVSTICCGGVVVLSLYFCSLFVSNRLQMAF